MARRFWGNINLDEIKNAVAGGVQPFEGKKGKYVPVQVWLEDQPDQFGNSLSISIRNKDTQTNFYLGNLKEAEQTLQTQPKANEPDLPF